MATKRELSRVVKREIDRLNGKEPRGSALEKMVHMRKILSSSIETLEARKRETRRDIDGTPHLQRAWNSMLHIYASGGDVAHERIKLADRLRDYRRVHRLTQDELAAKIGVGRRQLIKWEMGQSMPHNFFVKKMEAEKIL